MAVRSTSFHRVATLVLRSLTEDRGVNMPDFRACSRASWKRLDAFLLRDRWPEDVAAKPRGDVSDPFGCSAFDRIDDLLETAWCDDCQ